MPIDKEQFKLLRKKMGLSQDDFGTKIGVSGKYVGMIERGQTLISHDNTIGILFQMLSSDEKAGVSGGSMNEDESPYLTPKKTCRNIPVIGMAHAGDPLDFEETPESWQETIATECKDKNAFGCKIIGDSMAPSFEEGDVLVLMPNEEIFTGLFGVAKFRDGGVLFRRFNLEGESITAIPSNVRYPLKEYKRDEFEWIYPVYEARRYMWKGKK